MTLDEAIFYYTNTQSNSDVLGFLIDYKRLLDSDKKKDERIQELESWKKSHLKQFQEITEREEKQFKELCLYKKAFELMAKDFISEGVYTIEDTIEEQMNVYINKARMIDTYGELPE